MLDIQNLSFAYKKSNPVLCDFNFRIDNGGIYGLLGPNGAGKSTLLYLIAGLLTPSTGQVMYDGINTRRRLPSTLSEIFIVPEEFNLPTVSLSRYVKLYSPLYPRFDREAMERYLAIFGLDPGINLGALSMGQKKKAFMSFALACNTRMLLMDEPTNGLDIPAKSAFRRAISAAASDDRIIIISTHQVRDIDKILDHILVMNANSVILNASVNDIVSRLRFVTTTNPALINRALYAMQGIDGTAVVLPADGAADEETEINLETLFGFVLDRPDTASAIMERPADRQPAGPDLSDYPGNDDSDDSPIVIPPIPGNQPNEIDK